MEIRSHWTRYSCVLVSGFIEVSVRSIYTDFSRRKAIPQVADYVDAKLSNLRNVHMSKLLDLTRSFSPTWEVALKAATEGELADAVDSVVNLRNQIAHGVSTGTSFQNMKDYYKCVLKVIELLEIQCA